MFLCCVDSLSICLLSGFLNVGDDEIIEDDDDDAGGFASGAEGTHLENSGWSSRTRSVYVKLDKKSECVLSELFMLL
jgi:hypothetical protein